MTKIITYLYLLVGIVQPAQPSSQFTSYFQVVNELKNVVENSGNLRNYDDSDIKYIEEQIVNLAKRSLRLTIRLLIADYYINKEYEKYLGICNPSIDSLVNDNIKKAADYISDFMIEYMDYESINKYIKPIEGEDIKFGDFLKNNGASVVLKDIENAIVRYYFPELKTDTTLPSPKLLNVEENDHGLKRKADQANLAKNSGEIESNIENKLEQKQTWGEWFLSWF